MKKAKETTTLLNRRWGFFILIFAVLCICGALTFDEDKVLSIAVIALGIFFIFGYVLIVPSCYTFSKEGIAIRYAFLIKTFISWKNVKHLADCYCGTHGFPWWREYEIGYFDTRILFYQIGRVPKNKKTTELIEKYYSKNIDKYG